MYKYETKVKVLFFFFPLDVQLLHHCLLKMLSFPTLNCFYTFTKNQAFFCMSISRFSLLLYWSMWPSLCKQTQYGLLYDLKFILLLDPFFFQNCFSYSSSFAFPFNFRILLCTTTKCLVGILIVIMLNPHLNLGELISSFIQIFFNFFH